MVLPLRIAVFMLVAASCKQAPAPTAAADRDHIDVIARHRPPASKEDLDADPVVVHIRKFTVTKASFDPKHLAGGTATIELDLASIDTGSTERDDDLKSPAFMDVATLATATIDVANVKQQAGDHYTADATVAMHGMTQTYPVAFDVLATTDDSVRRASCRRSPSRCQRRRPAALD